MQGIPPEPDIFSWTWLLLGEHEICQKVYLIFAGMEKNFPVRLEKPGNAFQRKSFDFQFCKRYRAAVVKVIFHFADTAEDTCGAKVFGVLSWSFF